MSKEQSAEIAGLFKGVKNAGNLDYVTGWYKKAADYIKDTTIKCAFVSTNSICQGQQVPILWPLLFSQGIHIDFTHQTFKWSNAARGNAAVYCIIVGFSLNKDSDKKLFLYEDVKCVPKEVPAKQINAYLMDAQNVFIDSRTIPIDPVSEMGIGNKPIDDGNYLFLDNEKEEFIKQEPQSAAYFKRWYSSDEFINNKIR